MSQQLVPDDWDKETDGYAVLIACIPNSPTWKAIYRGAFWEQTWWNFWDRDTGSINEAKAIAQEVFEEVCIVNCQVLIDAINNNSVKADVQELTKAVKELNAILGSLQRDLTAPLPVNVDYSANGVNKPLSDVATHIGPHPAP